MNDPPALAIRGGSEPLRDGRAAYVYTWPRDDSLPPGTWTPRLRERFVGRELPESPEELAADSRWPGFFPSPICLVTCSDGSNTVLERVVGPSIVNRFPYVLALSVCRRPLSERHYVRQSFAEALERTGVAAAQLLPPGRSLDRALEAIDRHPDSASSGRIAAAGLPTRTTGPGAPAVLSDAYLVYEGRLLGHGQERSETGADNPSWVDVGSHRVYFLEIHRIELRQDIAVADSQVHWRSLPSWRPAREDEPVRCDRGKLPEGRYLKGYSADYRFPSTTTVGFEHDDVRDGMAVRHLPTGVAAEAQVELDNDRARWPCFFPSSVGMISTWAGDGTPNLMPCGSTTVVSRQPMVIAPSISYRTINERYAARHTFEILERTGRFTCGVPFLDEDLIEAMTYAGNVSLTDNPTKVTDAGLAFEPEEWAPLLARLPVSYECEVVGTQPLGTHAMIFGEVRRVLVRSDVTRDNPLEWCPWPDVAPTPG